MAGLTLINWIFGMAVIFISWERYAYDHIFDARVQGLFPFIWILCVGNGDSFLCAPWAWPLLYSSAVAVLACLGVNLYRVLSRNKFPRSASSDRWRSLPMLYCVISLGLAFAFGYVWFQYIYGPSTQPFVMSIIPLLFILLCVATGRHLWRIDVG